MVAKRALIKLHHLLAGQFGLDPLRLMRSLGGLPAYLMDWQGFRRGYSGPLAFTPCLHERYEEGGTNKIAYPVDPSWTISL